VFHLTVSDDAVLDAKFRPDLLGGVTASRHKTSRRKTQDEEFYLTTTHLPFQGL